MTFLLALVITLIVGAAGYSLSAPIMLLPIDLQVAVRIRIAVMIILGIASLIFLHQGIKAFFLTDEEDNKGKKKWKNRLMKVASVISLCAVIVGSVMGIHDINDTYGKKDTDSSSTYHSSSYSSHSTHHSSHSTKKTGTSSGYVGAYYGDPYGVHDYEDAEEFADDWSDWFDSWEDAEDYWEDNY